MVAMVFMAYLKIKPMLRNTDRRDWRNRGSGVIMEWLNPPIPSYAFHSRILHSVSW